jgi:transporter family-2 protein
MAITLDHFGWAGFRESPVTLGKVAGLLLIVAGIWLIRRG